jgi:(p)ppGpp synthase/HD superfamily hydrolase
MSRPLILRRLQRNWPDAERVAMTVHDGQFDKAGEEYWRHLARVCFQTGQKMYAFAERKRDEAMQIAWLHDILEPDPRPYGPVTADDLREEGFSAPVVEGALLLSGEMWSGMVGPQKTYAEKIQMICMLGSLPAIIVKLSDVEDNSDPQRLSKLPRDVHERLNRKYLPALEVLRDAAFAKGWVPPREKSA